MDPVTPPSSSITMGDFKLRHWRWGNRMDHQHTWPPRVPWPAWNKSALRPPNLLKLLWGDPTRVYSTTSCGCALWEIYQAAHQKHIRYGWRWISSQLTFELPSLWWSSSLSLPQDNGSACCWAFCGVFFFCSLSASLIDEFWWENCCPSSPCGRNQKSSPSTLPAADSLFVGLL